MSTNIKTKKGEKTNVKRMKKVIDYRPLDTKDRKDDEVWNSMEFMCESDEKEAEYESPEVVSNEATQRIVRFRLFGAKIKDVYNMKAA